MSTKQEVNLAAVIEKKGARLSTIKRPIPSPGPGELLVRNYAIAANPVDWKIQDYGFAITEYPNVLGSDGCGIVTAVGEGVTKFKVGDRVTGFAAVIYNQNPDHGAWQIYTIFREIATMRIPDFISFEEGTTFPMAFATSAIALFVNLGIPLPKDPIKPQRNGILIWGGSSSVGTAAIQLARNAGFKVFVTASPRHHKYLESLGAFEVFDYNDPDVVSKVTASAKSAGTPIAYAFDTITEGNTSTLSANILEAAGGKGGKLVLVLEWPSKSPKPEGIEISQTGAYRAGTDQAEIGSWLFNEYLPEQLEKKTIIPAPKVEIVEGGIEAAQKVFDQLKAGVSGKKLVVKVD
jgi:NADPH:quinone reductase-like Zn-dependent oxidoreductase